jgi:hypothetical protein
MIAQERQFRIGYQVYLLARAQREALGITQPEPDYQFPG